MKRGWSSKFIACRPEFSVCHLNCFTRNWHTTFSWQASSVISIWDIHCSNLTQTSHCTFIRGVDSLSFIKGAPLVLMLSEARMFTKPFLFLCGTQAVSDLVSLLMSSSCFDLSWTQSGFTPWDKSKLYDLLPHTLNTDLLSFVVESHYLRQQTLSLSWDSNWFVILCWFADKFWVEVAEISLIVAVWLWSWCWLWLRSSRFVLSFCVTHAAYSFTL